MSLVRLAVAEAKATLLADGSYVTVVRDLIAASRRVCLCNLFIVDVRPRHDADLLVHSLLVELAAAKWRGVDVRLLVGGSRTNLDMAIAAELACAAAQDMELPSRWLTAHRSRGSHAKWVVVDNCVLVGSHNWSSGAFRDQTQDSVLIRSEALAAYLSTRFAVLWQEAGGAG